jgi:uncharacterized MAPEG superfamily protein
MDVFVIASFPVLVAWSAGILVLHVVMQAQFAKDELGTAWHTGPRDTPRKSQGVVAGRMERASRNFRETYPAFVGLALALAVADPQSGWGHAGALLWFAARLVYVPLYLAGIPYVRSMVWLVAMLGLAIMFISVLF